MDGGDAGTLEVQGDAGRPRATIAEASAAMANELIAVQPTERWLPEGDAA